MSQIETSDSNNTSIDKLKTFIQNYYQDNTLLVQLTLAVGLITLIHFVLSISPMYHIQRGGSRMSALSSMGAMGAMNPMGAMGAFGAMPSNQGDAPARKPFTPFSSTLSFIIRTIGTVFKFLLLLICIFFVPLVPVLLYCLVAYFVIKHVFTNFFIF